MNSIYHFLNGMKELKLDHIIQLFENNHINIDDYSDEIITENFIENDYVNNSLVFQKKLMNAMGVMLEDKPLSDYIYEILLRYKNGDIPVNNDYLDIIEFLNSISDSDIRNSIINNTPNNLKMNFVKIHEYKRKVTNLLEQYTDLDISNMYISLLKAEHKKIRNMSGMALSMKELDYVYNSQDYDAAIYELGLKRYRMTAYCFFSIGKMEKLQVENNIFKNEYDKMKQFVEDEPLSGIVLLKGQYTYKLIVPTSALLRMKIVDRNIHRMLSKGPINTSNQLSLPFRDIWDVQGSSYYAFPFKHNTFDSWLNSDDNNIDFNLQEHNADLSDDICNIRKFMKSIPVVTIE